MRRNSANTALSAIFLSIVLTFPAGSILIDGEAENANGGSSINNEIIPDVPWWILTQRDSNDNKIDDSFERLFLSDENNTEFRFVISYDAPPLPGDIELLIETGLTIGYTPKYLDSVFCSGTSDMILDVSVLPGVVMVEEDLVVHSMLDTSIPASGIDRVWADYGLKGDNVTIAIVDTGIDRNHAGLDDLDDLDNTTDPKIIAFYDVVKNPGSTDGKTPAYDDNDIGHGTHCAAIASGTGAPKYKYVGVAPNSTLVGVKVLDATGSGYTSDVVQGIEWIIQNKAKFSIDIISLSLGSTGYYPYNNDGTSELSRMLDEAVSKGIVVAVAAGNEGKSWPLLGSSAGNPDRWGSISIPGDSNRAITVGAITDSSSRIWFSSIGPSGTILNPIIKPDVCAVGVDVYSARARSTTGYISYSGTSMATPHVAGLAALMLQASPGLTPDRVKSMIQGSSVSFKVAKPNGLRDPNNYYGHGAVNGFSAVGQAVKVGSYSSEPFDENADTYSFELSHELSSESSSYVLPDSSPGSVFLLAIFAGTVLVLLRLKTH